MEFKQLFIFLLGAAIDYMVRYESIFLTLLNQILRIFSQQTIKTFCKHAKTFCVKDCNYLEKHTHLIDSSHAVIV